MNETTTGRGARRPRYLTVTLMVAALSAFAFTTIPARAGAGLV